MTADEIKSHLRQALDGIEISSNEERELVIKWVEAMRNIGMWGLAGVEVLIGVHNKCVIESRNADSSWNKASIIVL